MQALVLLFAIWTGATPGSVLTLVAGQDASQPLRGPWVVWSGSEPQQAIAAGESWTSTRLEDARKTVHFQTRAEVTGAGKLGLFVPAMNGPYLLRVNGVQVGRCGNLAARLPPDVCPAASYPVAQALWASNQPFTVELEVRAVPDPGLRQVIAGPSAMLRLGTEAAVKQWAAGSQARARVRVAADFAVAVVCVMAAAVALVWLLASRREREYLWFTLLMLDNVAIYGIPVYEALRAAPGWTLPLGDLANDGYLLLLLYFVRALLGLQPSKAFRTIALLAAVVAMLDAVRVPLGALAWQRVSTWAEAAAYVLGAGWLALQLLRCTREKHVEARLLILPVMLVLAGGVFSYTRDLLLLQGYQQSWVEKDALILRQPYPLYLTEATDIVLLLTMVCVVLLRLSHAHREEARYAAEYAAARQVQQVLLPGPLLHLPGFGVEAEYQPAQVVGGDFYQLLGDGEGGLLVVVGDVAGKGLPAAMLVAMIVGVIRTQALCSAAPGELIRVLNGRLVGRAEGAFSTCLAAHLSPSGMLTLVNAGHLSPYLNGHELAIGGALPLGVDREATFAATAVQLRAGDRLTFLTDGVVEATNRNRELLGFERAEALSQRRAGEIVQAAQDWGQNDDVTVVTVEFQAQQAGQIRV